MASNPTQSTTPSANPNEALFQELAILTDRVITALRSPATSAYTQPKPTAYSDLSSLAEDSVRRVIGGTGLSTQSFPELLNRAFTRQIESGNRTVWRWNERSYAGRTEYAGQRSNAQEELFQQAKAAMERMLPRLQNLYSLVPTADEQEIEALRAILRLTWVNFVEELGNPAGPVEIYMDELNKTITDPTKGLLTRLGKALGVLNTTTGKPTHKNVVNLRDEENRIDFILLQKAIDQTIEYLEIFTDIAAVDLATKLQDLSLTLSVVAASVSELYTALDDANLGAAERAAVLIPVNTSQESRVFPANVEVGDVFRLTLDQDTISFTATAATVANVTEGLSALWNAATTGRFSEVTATDKSGHVELKGKRPGVPFRVTAATKNGGRNNDQTLIVREFTPAISDGRVILEQLLKRVAALPDEAMQLIRDGGWQGIELLEQRTKSLRALVEALKTAATPNELQDTIVKQRVQELIDHLGTVVSQADVPTT